MSTPAAVARPEIELSLLLAGTSGSRDGRHGRILGLARQIDYDDLWAFLVAQRLESVLGSRIQEVASRLVPRSFSQRLAAALDLGMRRALLFEGVTHQLTGALEDCGVPTVALKGALLGTQIYGEAAWRSTTDVDLLVGRSDLSAALGVLMELGYAPAGDARWTLGLPNLHYTLLPPTAGLPVVELHWRIHWGETAFSEALLERSIRSRGPRRLDRTDEFTSLLLFYARDSFHGLRLLTDIAAWWDAHGDELPDRPLDTACATHPQLARSLLAAAGLAHQLVGVPRERLLSEGVQPDRLACWTMELADWAQSGQGAKADANIALIDCLLSPGRQRWGFVRRYLLHPLELVAQTYGLPREARLRQVGRSLLHAIGASGRLAPHFAAGLVRAMLAGRRTVASREMGRAPATAMKLESMRTASAITARLAPRE